MYVLIIMINIENFIQMNKSKNQMNYILTRHIQLHKSDKSGKSNSHILYFLNGILLLKQKYPYDEKYDYGFQHRTEIFDEYILNGNLYQKRKYIPSIAWWRTCCYKKEGTVREVKYPISKKILSQFEIPNDLTIKINKK